VSFYAVVQELITEAWSHVVSGSLFIVLYLFIYFYRYFIYLFKCLFKILNYSMFANIR